MFIPIWIENLKKGLRNLLARGILTMAIKCSGCGVCCKLFLINLTEEEYRSGRYKAQFGMFGFVEDFDEAEMCAANIIEQKDDGSCIYLKDAECSIHEIRPKSCRNFFCASKDKGFKTMIDKIRKIKGSLTTC